MRLLNIFYRQQERLKGVKKCIQLRGRGIEHRLQIEKRRKKLEAEAKVFYLYSFRYIRAENLSIFCFLSRLKLKKYYIEIKNEKQQLIHKLRSI